MDCSMPVSSVLHYLQEFAQTNVHWIKWCHPTISSSVVPFSSCPLCSSRDSKSLLQHHSLKESALQFSALFVVLLSHLYMTTRKTITLTTWTFFGKVSFNFMAPEYRSLNPSLPVWAEPMALEHLHGAQTDQANSHKKSSWETSGFAACPKQRCHPINILNAIPGWQLPVETGQTFAFHVLTWWLMTQHTGLITQHYHHQWHHFPENILPKWSLWMIHH